MKSGKTRNMPRAKRGGPPPFDNSYAAIGRRLKQLRLAIGKTQEELGKDLGVGVGMISSCENGNARLSVDHMIELLKKFGAPLDWIYLGIEAHLPDRLRIKLDQVSRGTEPPSSS